MTKLNKKGFLLIETLIVTVFVVSIFIFIYSNTIPLIGKYEQRFKYDDLDSVYAADLIRNMIIESPRANNIYSLVTASPTSEHIVELTCQGMFPTDAPYREYCNELVKELDISSIYLTHYTLETAKNEESINYTTNRGLKSYIDYLPKFSGQASLYMDQHRLIIVRKVEEFNYTYTRYANIELVH